MVKTATKNKPSAKRATKKSSASKTARKRQRLLEQHVERNGAHAYAERIPIIADVLKENGRGMTVKEIFAEVKTGPAGLFGKERRVAATFRYDQRQETPVFERGAGNMITVRKRPRRSPLGGRVDGKRVGTASERAFVAAGNNAKMRKTRKQRKNGAVSTKRTRKAA